MNKKFAITILVAIFTITACAEMPEEGTAAMQMGMSNMVTEVAQE